MGRVFFEILAFINIVLFLKFAGTDTRTKNKTMLREFNDNMSMFEHFKETYGRVYPDDEAEQRGYHNFVNNLAEVNRLNKAHPTRIIAYQLNRFADVDPEAIEEQFGIQLKPYDNMEHGNPEALQRERNHKFLEDMHLHDLNEVDELYKIWIKKYGKGNFTKKLNKMVHYYRFVKTVAETNKKKFAGQDVSLGIDADTVREPNQYFYG